MPTIQRKDQAMNKLTIIIPCKNEEHNMEALLQSVQWADEILVVDSYSTDKTVEIANKYSARILEHDYNYSASQKNWAIPQASHDWILLVDADERISENLKVEILAILEKGPGKKGYWINRENWFMGKKVSFGGVQGDKVIRLFHKDCRYEDKKVHAEVIVDGAVGLLKNKLVHNSYKNLGHYLEKVHRYNRLSAMDREEKTGGISGFHLIIKPAFKFFQFYILKLGFLDGFVGFVLASLSSYSIMLRYFYMWELRHANKIARDED